MPAMASSSSSYYPGSSSYTISSSAGAAAPIVVSSTTAQQTAPEKAASPAAAAEVQNEAAGAQPAAQANVSAEESKSSVDTSKSSELKEAAGAAAPTAADRDKVQDAIKSDSAIPEDTKSGISVTLENGKIVLKGSVKSDTDKTMILDKARTSLGSDNKIDDQIKVEGSDTTKPEKPESSQ